MNSNRLYFRLLSYVRPYWKAFALSIVTLVFVAATEPLFPALMKPLLDEGFTKKDQAFIIWAPILLVGLFLVRGVLVFINAYLSSWISNKVISDIRVRLFEHLVRLPNTYFDNRSSGALVSKVAYDVNEITGAATNVLTTVVRDTLTIAGLLGWLFWLDWKLTLLSLTIAPLIVIVVRISSKRLRKMSREWQRSMGMITHVIEEAATSQKVVKVFQSEAYETERFRRADSVQRGFAMRGKVAAAAVTPLVQLFSAVAIAVVISVALAGNGGATSTAGGFMSFITAMLLLLNPIKRLSEANSVLQRGLSAAESVFELLDEPAELDQGTITMGRATGKIDFINVSFTYPGTEKLALDKIDLNIAPGESVALVGRSGSGKSTLVSLLARYYDATQGEIRLDGTPIRDLKLMDLRRQIALVSQDVRLFNDTIAANVAYGRPEADRSTIENALRAAHAWEFVSQMPEGIDTLIGENGVKLSGGQRQRLAIARAFFKDAPLLILDEATSALDSESERQIQSALQKLMLGRTTVVIAHRLSTIEQADRIVVMDHGSIVESGQHGELLARNGYYAHFQRLQHSHDSIDGQH